MAATTKNQTRMSRHVKTQPTIPMGLLLFNAFATAKVAPCDLF